MKARRRKKSGLIKASLADGRHLLRFLKAQANIPIEEIARNEGVSAASIRTSIRSVEMHRAQHSHEQSEQAVRQMIIGVMPQATDTINELLTAKMTVEINDQKTGKKKIVEKPDRTTQLEATRVIKDIIVGIQPKAPLIAQKVQQTNTTQSATIISKSETVEDRMRRLRAKAQQHNQLPPETAGVPEHIDQEIDEVDIDDGDDGEE